jgi:hypothetical protein
MISRSSRLLHTALVVACGAGIAYAPARAQTSLTLPLGPSGHVGPITIGNLAPPPVHLLVPPNQARDWSRYCGLYQACGVPIRFVSGDWYRDNDAPRVQAAQPSKARQARQRWPGTRQDDRVVTAERRVDAMEDRRDRDRDDDDD